MFFVRYAWSELTRRRGRTIVTVSGLALGVALVIVIASLTRGLDEAQDKALDPLASTGTDLTVPFDVVASLPGRLRSGQPAFDLTGGLHATGLFTEDGDVRCVREDVGRHNAMDKVIGWAFGEGVLPLARNVLCVSGRLSFELVQKAAVAGCPVLVAVGAPSSLAVELADDRGLTLCGFVRDGAATVYTHPHRVRP